jgi:hypothetical protein
MPGDLEFRHETAGIPVGLRPSVPVAIGGIRGRA